VEACRLPHFLNRLRVGGEVVSITRRLRFTPRKIAGTHFCQGLNVRAAHTSAGTTVARLATLGFQLVQMFQLQQVNTCRWYNCGTSCHTGISTPADGTTAARQHVQMVQLRHVLPHGDLNTCRWHNCSTSCHTGISTRADNSEFKTGVKLTKQG
jgi:hypothetical protein